jgi:tetratricopeptide (TPR) repeat protein
MVVAPPGPGLLLLLLVAAAGCAPGPAIPRAQLNGWHAVDIADVRIVGDVGADEIQRFGEALALFEGVFAHLAGWTPGGGGIPVRVVLVREPGLARHFGLGGGVAGWALTTLDGGFSAVAARESHAETRFTLFHEYTHVQLRRHRRAPVPPWYDEGLASFFGTLEARDGAVVVGAAPGAEVAWLAARGPLSLEDLFEGDVWGRRADGVRDFYATAWGLAHYLVLHPRGRREMAQLAEQLARGVPPAEARRSAFGRSTEALEAELRVHVSHLARGVPIEVVLEPEGIVRPPVGRAQPLGADAAACALGELALQLAEAGGDGGGSGLATRLLGMAAEAGPASARCEAALAEARALAGDAGGAQNALARALARAPDDARVSVLAGRAELARADVLEGDTAAAALRAGEKHFRRALAHDRRSAAAWFGLGQGLARAGQPDAALSALETARRLGWSPSLDLALGELVLARGERERAFALLWPLVQDPHRGPSRDEASALLERAGLLPAPRADAER